MLVGWRSVRWRKCQLGWTREQHERKRQEASFRWGETEQQCHQRESETDDYGVRASVRDVRLVRYTVVEAVEQHPILTLV